MVLVRKGIASSEPRTHAIGPGLADIFSDDLRNLRLRVLGQTRPDILEIPHQWKGAICRRHMLPSIAPDMADQYLCFEDAVDTDEIGETKEGS